jgi:murein DD-endopeptidase MepM/ murein hydrolase activator NlpD
VASNISLAKQQFIKVDKLSLVKKRAMAVPKIPEPARKPKLTKYQSTKPKKQNSKAIQKSITPPKIKTSGRFTWPVQGRLLSLYGSKGDGLHNDGINIVAPRGASVKAAGSGVVAYAGNQLPGFGNLLLIKHSGGWVTAYAHNSSLLVKRGDKVGKGQVVAKVGASGNVTDPQLHFEIRKGKKAINPLRHLKRYDTRLKKGFDNFSLLTGQ